MKTVYYNGRDLYLHEEVASANNLKQGQNITSESLFWRLIGENASMGLAKIYIERAKTSADGQS